MEISPIAANGLQAAEDRKIAEACRQFEGVLWRQMVEKSLQPMLKASETSADRTGTYGYLIGDAVAQAVSGGSHGFAALLEEQLNPRKER